jgi:hypothetical protein
MFCVKQVSWSSGTDLVADDVLPGFWGILVFLANLRSFCLPLPRSSCGGACRTTGLGTGPGRMCRRSCVREVVHAFQVVDVELTA